MTNRAEAVAATRKKIIENADRLLYEKGYQDGLQLKESINLDLDTLPDSQAGTVRHKSPHYAYALGYQQGVADYYA